MTELRYETNLCRPSKKSFQGLFKNWLSFFYFLFSCRFLFDVNSQGHKYYKNLVKCLRPMGQGASKGVESESNASSGMQKRKRKSRWDPNPPKSAGSSSSSSSSSDAAVAAALAVAAEIEHSIPMSNKEEEERQKQIKEQQEVILCCDKCGKSFHS